MPFVFIQKQLSLLFLVICFFIFVLIYSQWENSGKKSIGSDQSLKKAVAEELKKYSQDLKKVHAFHKKNQ